MVFVMLCSESLEHVCAYCERTYDCIACRRGTDMCTRLSKTCRAPRSFNFVSTLSRSLSPSLQHLLMQLDHVHIFLVSIIEREREREETLALHCMIAVYDLSRRTDRVWGQPARETGACLSLPLM